jgi:hypothetical protein
MAQTYTLQSPAINGEREDIYLVTSSEQVIVPADVNKKVIDKEDEYSLSDTLSELRDYIDTKGGGGSTGSTRTDSGGNVIVSTYFSQITGSGNQLTFTTPGDETTLGNSVTVPVVFTPGEGIDIVESTISNSGVRSVSIDNNTGTALNVNTNGTTVSSEVFGAGLTITSGEINLVTENTLTSTPNHKSKIFLNNKEFTDEEIAVFIA